DPDFDGQQVSIKLHHDGQFATFKASSGRISYEMVSYASQEPEATIFLSSASEAKIVMARLLPWAYYWKFQH
ncbi:hypothetical protein MKW92_006553, partial [Papaver armeniacum]